NELIEDASDPHDLARVDVEVAGLTLQALAADQGRVYVYGRAGQIKRLPFRTGHQHDGAKAGRAPDAYGRYRRLDVLHRVVDRKARADRAAGRVDVDLDVLLRVVRGKVDELRHDQVRHHVVDGAADEDDAVLEQARVDVEGALAVAALVLGDGRDESHDRNCTRYIRAVGRAAAMAPSDFFSGLRKGVKAKLTPELRKFEVGRGHGRLTKLYYAEP